MKRQTLIMLAVFAVAALALLAPAFVIQRKVSGAGPRQRVPFGAVSIEIPVGCERRPKQEGNWETREYQTTLRTLRLATEPSRGTPFPEICTAWFQLPRYAPGPTVHEGGGYTWFFKEVPLFGRGAYVMRKRGKTVAFIAFFEQQGLWHWAMLTTRGPLEPVKEVFDQSLASMRLPDGTEPGPALAQAIEPAAREGGYRFVQPLALLFAIPSAVLLLIFAIASAVRRRSGRLPGPEASGGSVPWFLEGGVEIALKRSLQYQLMDAALGIDSESLTVYTFGTPFLVIPRRAISGRATAGQGWFGATFVAIELEGPLDFRKFRWKYRAWSGPTRLKIYTREPLRLLAALA